ncbi:hypothetical protein E2C01_006558 [Portunus trituberculatus]|uniref:Uncharacterized protein n=1 Tax=Portunus trituberculatus TaxID=210409 RepID=A0A5B7CVJ1_PORTR|nr:hypothetical protein [Portunus trituberculatus]
MMDLATPPPLGNDISLKAPPYHTTRQALEYTSASRGQNAHRSLPYPSPLLIQNKNRSSTSSSSHAQHASPAMSPSVAKKKRKSLTLKNVPFPHTRVDVSSLVMPCPASGQQELTRCLGDREGGDLR